MAKLQEFEEVLARLNTATNAIAAKLTKLADQIEAGGMTKVEEDGIVAALRTVATTAEGLAADPENPVPPVA